MSTAPQVPAPTCPTHGQSMKEWKPGFWSCSVKMGIGAPGANANGYCDHKVKPERPGGGGRSFQRSPEEQRAIAAQSVFSSACARYAGDPEPNHNEIIALARLGYQFVMQCSGATASGANGVAGQPTSGPPPKGTAKPAAPPPVNFKVRFLEIAALNSYRRPETQLRLANAVRKSLNLDPLETLDAPDVAWEAMCVALESRSEFKKPAGAGGVNPSAGASDLPVPAEVNK